MASKIKILPHSEEAEKSVLGSVFLDREAIIKIADVLRADDFYFDNNGKIYEAMFYLANSGKPVDLVTVATELEKKKVLSKVGGAEYLAELTDEPPTAANVFEYAQIVKAKSTLRKLIKSGQEIAALGFNEEDQTQNLLDKAEKELFSVTQNLIKNRFTHIREILESSYEKIASLHDDDEKEKYRGVSSGYEALDNLLSGFNPADLVIIAARPSMGKTSLALSIAQNVALKKKKSVGILSLEMSKEQLTERIFCGMLEVDSWRIHKGKLDDAHFEKLGPIMDELARADIFIDDSSDASVAEIRAKARRLQMEHGLDILFIDYLQLMHAGNTNLYAGNRVQEISEISRSLKALARELKIPILALSQLSRAVENRPNKTPQLADLRESGAIEQDADVVLMMYREDYYEEESDKEGVTDIFVRKNRNGPVGRVELMFRKEQMKFYNLDYSHGEGEDMGTGKIEDMDF